MSSGLTFITKWLFVPLVVCLSLLVIFRPKTEKASVSQINRGVAIQNPLASEQPQMSAEVRTALYRLDMLKPGDLVEVRQGFDNVAKYPMILATFQPVILAVFSNDGKKIETTCGDDCVFHLDKLVLAGQMATNSSSVQLNYRCGDNYGAQCQQFVLQAVERAKRSHGIK